MSTNRLNDLEHRLRAALAASLNRATAGDPAWRKFEASLGQGAGGPVSEDEPQNGTSSPPADPPSSKDAGP